MNEAEIMKTLREFVDAHETISINQDQGRGFKGAAKRTETLGRKLLKELLGRRPTDREVAYVNLREESPDGD